LRCAATAILVYLSRQTFNTPLQIAAMFRIDVAHHRGQDFRTMRQNEPQSINGLINGVML
jgi:hypothetical protein